MDWSTQCSSVLRYLPELAQIHVHWVGDAIQLSHPCSPPSLPALNLSLHQSLFQYWGFSFSISPSNKYSGLISFRNDWFGLFVVQGTLKSLLQHHNLKASVLWHSAFFMVRWVRNKIRIRTQTVHHPFRISSPVSLCWFTCLLLYRHLL